MKAKELQIGDWVCYNKPNGYVTRVDAIRRTGEATLGYVYSIDCKRDERDPLYEKAPVDSFNVEILHPIDITPAILEANGFERSKVFVEWKYTGDELYMLWKPFPWIKILNDDVSMMFPCEYVHEIQHALRLTKIDKEIKV